MRKTGDNRTEEYSYPEDRACFRQRRKDVYKFQTKEGKDKVYLKEMKETNS